MKTTKNIKTSRYFSGWTLLKDNAFVAALLLSVIALFLRFYRVGFLSFWVDEYMHVNPALEFVNGGTIWNFENNGVFLTFCVAASFKIFGVTEFASRLPSVLFGSFSILLMYLFAKKLFNKSIGVISALLGAFSLYGIVWSRIARNYASFEFSYLLLLLVFWMAFTAIPDEKQASNNFFSKNNLNKKYIFLLPFAFIFSLLNHQLTFLSIFGFSVYIIIIAAKKVFSKERNRFFNLYAILSYLIFAGAIVFFNTALLESIASPILKILLSDRIVDWILPDWAYLFQKLKSPTERFSTLLIYLDVIKNDYNYIYYIGGAGFLLAFFIEESKLAAAFLFSSFVVPFLLMSFVFREPATPNYLLFIYPLFIIAIAVSIFFIFQKILPVVIPEQIRNNKLFENASLIILLIGIFYAIPKNEIKSLLTTTEHGQLVNAKLCHVPYVNWKESGKINKKFVKESDILISTWPAASNFYFKRDNSIWFRQRHYDVNLRKYVNNESVNEENDASSLGSLIKTIENNDRGWLFADYYFDNILTDPIARLWVFKHMIYHPNLSLGGTIRVFSWDKITPVPIYQEIVEDLKRGYNTMSYPYIIYIKEDEKINDSVDAYIFAEGVNANDEAYILLNKEHYIAIPKGKMNNVIEMLVAKIPKKYLQNGSNEISFVYNIKTKSDIENGFIIYNFILKLNETTKIQLNLL